VIVNREKKEAAENYCHRHRHRTERKPSAASAVGRDKKDENNSPGSYETQRGPHLDRYCLRIAGAQKRDRPELSRKRVKICLLRAGRLPPRKS
jgi:hypothetical protein